MENKYLEIWIKSAEEALRKRFTEEQIKQFNLNFDNVRQIYEKFQKKD
jgi:hypothetical protein